MEFFAATGKLRTRNNTSSTTGAAAGDVRLREPRGASPEMRRGGVAGAGPRRRCAAGLELGLTGDVPRGPLLELRGAASRGGSHRRCAVLRAAGDLAGDAPRGPRKKKLGRFFILFFWLQIQPPRGSHRAAMAGPAESFGQCAGA